MQWKRLQWNSFLWHINFKATNPFRHTPLCIYTSRGVKFIFMGGHVSLAVAFKGPNVTLGLYECNYSLTAEWELSAAAGWEKGARPDKTRWRAGSCVCHLCPKEDIESIRVWLVKCEFSTSVGMISFEIYLFIPKFIPVILEQFGFDPSHWGHLVFLFLS